MNECIDIDKLARLARLSLEPSEREKLACELSEIIALAAECRLACQAADLDPAASSSVNTKLAVLRDDTPKAGLARELLLSNAPNDSAAQSKYFSTVRVIEN